MIFLYWFV